MLSVFTDQKSLGFGQTVNNESYLATEVFRGKKNVATKGKKLGGRFMLKSGNVGKSVFEKKLTSRMTKSSKCS